MKQYDLYLPSHYNDGRSIAVGRLEAVKRLLVEEFGGLTHFPQENEGHWTFGGVTFRDRVVVLRVLSKDADHTRQFFAELRVELMRTLEQSDILITELDVKVVA